MSLKIGLCLGLGQTFIGAPPSINTDLPATLITSASSIVVVGAEAINALDPITIVNDVTVHAYYHADLGTTVATGVSQWNDQKNTNHAVQATGTAQPVLNAAALFGHKTITFDGVDDRLTIGTLNLPPPGAGTGWWVWSVLKRTADVTNGTLVGAGSTTGRIQRGSATQVRANNGVAGTLVTMTVGTWYRLENLFFNDAAADYLKIGSTNGGTGTATGANDPAAGAYTIGCTTTGGTSPGAWEIAALMITNGKPGSTVLANLDTWVTKHFGGLVSV